MQMTDREVVASFNRADNKRGQVVILAELNACDKNAICEILRRNGVEESLIPDFSRKTIVVENQDKKGGVREMARKAAEQAVKTPEEPIKENQQVLPEETVKNYNGTAIPKAVVDVIQAEMQRLCEVILEAETKRAELAAFIMGVK